MNSSPALTAAKTVIHGLRWVAVLAILAATLGDLIDSALGPQALVLRPAPLAVVQNLVFLLVFLSAPSFVFVAAGATIAPQARLTTAFVLAAARVPLSFWNHVLSRVSLVELVLFQGGGDYTHFALEALGAMLGVVYIFWSEKARASVASEPPDLRHLTDPSKDHLKAGHAPTRANAAPTAAETAIRCLRWAAVLVLVCSELGELVYSALGGLVYSAMGPQSLVVRPAPLAVVKNLAVMLFAHPSRSFIFVAAGTMIAPRVRRTTAIVLAAALVALAFRNHVLSTGGPWSFWTINDTHFTLEAFGAVLGVVFIFWWEKTHGPVARVLPSP